MSFDQIMKDTPPSVEAVQIQLLRDAGQARRIQLTLSLSQSARSLSRHNLRQKYPDLSDFELNIKFVELLYGKQLAQSVREYINAKKYEQH